MFYNYFRNYSPDKGRYLESDPIGLNSGVNTYAYVESNPLLYVDSEGYIGRVQTRDVFCLVNEMYQIELHARYNQAKGDIQKQFDYAEATSKRQQAKDNQACKDGLDACITKECPDLEECKGRFWECVKVAYENYDRRTEYNFNQFTNVMDKVDYWYSVVGGGFECPEL